MLQILDELGVEVHQAQATFEAGGKKYLSGTHVVLMTQPFRAFAKDLLEKQTYPVQRVSPGGPIERPYDVTGWTLPYQMGVDTVEVPKKFDAKLERVSPVPAASGQFESGPCQRIAGFFISHVQNNSAIAVNRLLARGVKVVWDPGGAIFVPHSTAIARDLEGWSRQLGIRVKAAASAPTGQLRSLAKPRIALYRPWMPSMDEGWTRWVLEQYEFPYSVLRDAEIKTGKLIDNYDAILIARQSKDSLLKGATQDWIRPEHRGALGADGVAALKEFVRAGGTLITLGSASLLPAEEFPLPLKSSLKGLRGEQFSCPGSILRVFVDNTSPVGYGMPDEVPAVFYNDLAFDLAAPLGEQSVRVIAKYPSGSLLKSGWIGGPEYLEDRVAAAEVTIGKGRVIVLGFSAVNRAQPHATFKLLFNSLHYAAAKPLLIPAKK